jgi:hypothetical protein
MMRAMRALAAFLCGLLAVLATLVALPAAWIGTNVADEGGYVAFSGSPATDPEAQEAVAGGIAREIVNETGLPAQLTSTLTVILEDTAARVADEPGFSDIWDETQRRAHRSVFDSETGEQAGVDIAPLAQFLVDSAAGSLPVGVAVPETLLVELERQPDQRLLDLIRATGEVAWLATAVAVVAALSAIVLARRRSTALLWLGMGALVGAAVLAVASRLPVPGLLQESTSPSEFEAAFQQVLVDRAIDSFGGWLVWLAITGAVAAAVGFLLRVVGSRRARSGRAA